MIRSAIVLIIIAVLLKNSYQSYEIPEPEIIVYRQRGFRVSIPHTPGIRLFSFHGNINKEINDSQIGDYFRDITINSNGKWTFYERKTKLNIGDTIYYWLHVVKHGVDYKFQNGQFTVKDLTLNPLIRNASEGIAYIDNDVDDSAREKKLKIKGRIPQDGIASGAVSFVLREKLGISPRIISAERHPDGSIVFEVPTVEDKLSILAAAKKLNKTSIYIQQY